jgi:hypothetical protein
VRRAPGHPRAPIACWGGQYELDPNNIARLPTTLRCPRPGVTGKSIGKVSAPPTLDQTTCAGARTDMIIDKPRNFSDLVDANHIRDDGVSALLQLFGN